MHKERIILKNEHLLKGNILAKILLAKFYLIQILC